MRYLPYPPKRPVFQSWVDDSFIGKYGININNVVTGGVNKPHYHDYFQIYYTVSGKYEDEINGVSVLCDEGCVSLICPYTVHRLDTTHSPADTKVISFSFLPDAFSSKGIPLFPLSYKEAVFNGKVLPTFFRLKEADLPKASGLMCEISSEYQKKSDMFLTKIFREFGQFFELCANSSDTNMNARALHSHINYADIIYNSVSFIKEHFSENLTIDSAAHRAAMARRSFTKLFREVTGRAYHDIFMTYRLSKALELLRFSRKSISEISNELGFSGNAHFTKEFIKQFTLPPLKLRREMMERTRNEEMTQNRERRSFQWSDIRSRDLMNEHYKISIGKDI